MGNSLHGVGLLGNDVQFPYHIKLGKHAAIDIDETIIQNNSDEVLMSRYMKPDTEWSMSYMVDGSKCCLNFRRNFSKDNKLERILFSMKDDICLDISVHLFICKGENFDTLNDPRHFYLCSESSNPEYKFQDRFNTTTNMLGIVTETIIKSYGIGSKGGYLIYEKKKRSKNEEPYMATLAHYYVFSKGDFFGGSKIDIGLSMIIKVRASNDVGMDIKVEGPTQHPTTALFYMFDELNKTGIWKPTSCPHCAKVQKMQRNPMLWQESESEDSDNFPPRRPNYPKQMGESVVANGGAIKGNNNGNLILRSRQTIFQGKFFK